MEWAWLGDHSEKVQNSSLVPDPQDCERSFGHWRRHSLPEFRAAAKADSIEPITEKRYVEAQSERMNETPGRLPQNIWGSRRSPRLQVQPGWIPAHSVGL